MNITSWVPFAAAAATLLGAIIAYAAARRTTQTTWRSKTAEWQFESVVAFFDAAMHFLKRRDYRELLPGLSEARSALDIAWHRLCLTGPNDALGAAQPMYQAAIDLHDGAHHLGAWYGLKQRVDRVVERLDFDIELAEDIGGSPTQAERDAFAAAREASDRLAEVINLPSLGDLDPVKKAVDRYSELFSLTELAPAHDSRCVTANEIDEAVALHGHPTDLLRAWMDDCKRLQRGADEFIPQMRGWLDGKHLQVKAVLRLGRRARRSRECPERWLKLGEGAGQPGQVAYRPSWLFPQVNAW